MRKKDKIFAKDWVANVKRKLESDEDRQRILKMNERINRESSYSEIIRDIENIIEKALNKKLFEQLVFIDYKTILYYHFMELEGIKEKD